MKNIFLFIVSSLFPFVLLSQFNNSIEVIAGLDYSYRSISERDSLASQSLLNYYEGDIPKLNWHSGLAFNFKLKQKLHLKLGIQYSAIGYKHENQTDINFGGQFDGTENPPIINSDVTEVQIIKDYQYINLPFLLRYELGGDKKIQPFIEFGLIPSVYLRTKSTQITNLERKVFYDNDTEFEGFNAFQLLGSGAFGIQYNLNENYQIMLMPNFRYHFSKLADAPINIRLFSGGLELGLRRSLN